MNLASSSTQFPPGGIATHTSWCLYSPLEALVVHQVKIRHVGSKLRRSRWPDYQRIDRACPKFLVSSENRPEKKWNVINPKSSIFLLLRSFQKRETCSTPQQSKMIWTRGANLCRSLRSFRQWISRQIRIERRVRHTIEKLADTCFTETRSLIGFVSASRSHKMVPTTSVFIHVYIICHVIVSFINVWLVYDIAQWISTYGTQECPKSVKN